MKLKGENTREVITRVKERMEEASKALPAGVSLVTFYDQNELIEKAVHSVEKSLIEGGVLVVAVLLFYEQSLVSDTDLSQVKKAFDLNGWVGIVYFATTALALYVG